MLSGQWTIPTGHGFYSSPLSTRSPFKVSPRSFGTRNTRTLAQPSDVTLLRSPTLSCVFIARQAMSKF